jgi:hypothetical protein
MKSARCKGGCGKTRGTATIKNKGTRADAAFTTMPEWTCDDCARRLEGKKAGIPEKKDPAFRLVSKPPADPKTPTKEAPVEGAAHPPTENPPAEQGPGQEASVAGA